MRLGITAKLFIAVLLTNVVTAAAVAFGVRIAFDRGFERYVEEREDARLARLAQVFADAYRENGSWEFLRNNEARWVELNHLVRPSPPNEFRGRPADVLIPRHDGPRPGFGEGAGGPRMGPPPSVVLDAKGAVVAGTMKADASLRRRPILVDGKQVGTLANPQRPTLMDLVDKRFQGAIGEAALWVLLIAIALSAVVAWLLARGLLSPVKRIATATRRLADGDYATRVESTSRDELGRLVDDFNRLGNALQKHEASRRGFMADVSHELRTPIAVLKGELEAIEDGVRQPTPEALQSLRAEVDRMGKLVDDIHDLSLADVGGIAYHFEPLDLAALVRESLDHAAGRLAARQLALEVVADGNATVRGDARRLTQLIGNLLENTLRYTDANGRLRVTISRRDNRTVLAWEDSAPGVPEASLPKLFDRLYRVEASRNREAGGSGLGLAIVRSIAEAHGGTVSAQPSSLGGLLVEVRLP